MLVRDYYSNRRGGIAELQLDVMSRVLRHDRLTAQITASKMAEIGRILISRNLLRFTQESQVFFYCGVFYFLKSYMFKCVLARIIVTWLEAR